MTRKSAWALATGLGLASCTTNAAPSSAEDACLSELIATRRSVRSYGARPVAEQRIDDVLEAARAAPSAGNLQSYQIVVVRDEQRRRQLSSAAAGQDHVAQAPVVLVFLADPQHASPKYGGRGERLYSVQDATIAASYAQLTAHSLRLASVWVGAFDDQQVREAVDAPEHLNPVALLLIGHSDASPAFPGRRPLSELVHRERYGAGSW
jgi:nitroreductase